MPTSPRKTIMVICHKLIIKFEQDIIRLLCYQRMKIAECICKCFTLGKDLRAAMQLGFSYEKEDIGPIG